MQPTEAPQVQVIERPGFDSPNPDGFGSVQREMSVSSHESLFSIHVDSFTRFPVPATSADPYKSEELDNAVEFMHSKLSISLRGAFQEGGGGGENINEDLGTNNVPVSSETKVELVKEGNIDDQDSSALPTQCWSCCKPVNWTCCQCKRPAWSGCFSFSSCSCKCITWQSFMCNCSICGGRSSNMYLSWILHFKYTFVFGRNPSLTGRACDFKNLGGNPKGVRVESRKEMLIGLSSYEPVGYGQLWLVYLIVVLCQLGSQGGLHQERTFG